MPVKGSQSRGHKFNSSPHPRQHQPPTVQPLSFPLYDNGLPWWAVPRGEFVMRCQELHQAKAWGKGQDARVGGGVEFSG